MEAPALGCEESRILRTKVTLAEETVLCSGGKKSIVDIVGTFPMRQQSLVCVDQGSGLNRTHLRPQQHASRFSCKKGVGSNILDDSAQRTFQCCSAHGCVV